MKVWLKLLVKDFRRINWPKSKKLVKYFILTLIFVSLATGFLFSVDFLFTKLWDMLRIGING
jgi:preprotein translocase SecE subunit